jgi:hypothetical protein
MHRVEGEDGSIHTKKKGGDFAGEERDQQQWRLCARLSPVLRGIVSHLRSSMILEGY